MSAVLSPQASAQTDVGARLAFQKQLQAVTNKIHATNNIDEIMLEVSADVCALFNADRLTIYSIGEDKQSIVSKVKTGLNSFKDLKLPIAEHSLAGYVALSKKSINIKDCYDDNELRARNRVGRDPRGIVVGGSCNQPGPKPAKKAFVPFGGLFLLRHSRFVSDPAYERQKGKSGSASHVL